MITKNWAPASQMSLRQQQKQQMSTIKRSPKGNFQFSCVESLSGFLDRKLHVCITSNGRVALRVNSRHRLLMDQLSEYLGSVGVSPGTVREQITRKQVYWTESKNVNSLEILRLIQPHLIRKRSEVDLVLANVSNLSSISRELYSLRGTNSCYFREMMLMRKVLLAQLTV